MFELKCYRGLILCVGKLFIYLLRIPIVLEHLLTGFSMFFFPVLIIIYNDTKKIKCVYVLITVASISSTLIFKVLLIILYSMYFIVPTLRDNLYILTIHLFWLIHYL